MNPADRGATNPSNAAFLGSDDDWIRWRTAAWRSLADPAGEYPRWSARLRETADHVEQAGAVVSLLEVTAFTLGWRRPDIGLAAWIDLGRPTDHPTLALIDNWWGDDIALITTWAALPECAAFTKLDEYLSNGCHLDAQNVRDLPRNHQLERDQWVQDHCVGGWDPFHSAGYASIPVQISERDQSLPDPRWVTDPVAVPPAATMIASEYTGWYAELMCGVVKLPTTARSWRVDVVVQPFGWLGRYRRSRETGMCFTGQHRWHMLGYS